MVVMTGGIHGFSNLDKSKGENFLTLKLNLILDGEKTDNILRQMGLEMGKKEGTSNLWEEMTKAREKSKGE